MAEIQNLKALQAKLNARFAASRKDDNVAVAVGYTATYALWVHETMERHAGEPRKGRTVDGVWRPGKGVYWGPSLYGPKFLEGPARALGKVLGKIIADMKRQGKTLAQALLVAGLRLQRESQKLVPVEYGNLKNSAFTRLEDR